ncbi:MAG: hypothetical protein GY865_05000 [candidate division Zixibacteria bacterium]|nr:hypothetical protein [candidate division Zixibacteria bacterium]
MKFKTELYILIIISVFCLLLLSPACFEDELVVDPDLKSNTFTILDNIRDQKIEILTNYFLDVQKTASNIIFDKIMLESFYTMQNNFRRNNKYSSDSDIELKIDIQYAENYGDFYDILFIDSSGFIFHSIKQEWDYQTNILTGQLKNSNLAKYMLNKTTSTFVDYEHYAPSDEPAAFFVTTVKSGDIVLGWFVMQYAVNRINTILTDRTGLGRTGEVYLVNKNRLMLTDSRFIKEKTILKKQIETDAIKLAFEETVNNKIITDYRGVSVFSSFKQFNLFGSPWVVVAEIDEDEIITNYYYNNSDSLSKKILSHLESRQINYKDSYNNHKPSRIVDMNEYDKAYPGEILKTYGVTTCTAVAVLYEKKFVYLLHLGPTDKIYSDSDIDDFLNNQRTDFIGRLTEKIKHFDIYPYELNNLKFVIVANHDYSFHNIVDRLIGNDINLSQITFLYNPKATLANVFCDPENDFVTIEWGFENSNDTPSYELSSDVENLSAVFKKVSSY